MAALSPQTTGTSNASEQIGIMDDLQARLRMQGTPRSKRSDRRKARNMPSTPSLDRFDFSGAEFDSNIEADASSTDLAGIAARLLGQLGTSASQESGLSNGLEHQDTPDSPRSLSTQEMFSMATLDLPDFNNLDSSSFVTPPRTHRNNFSPATPDITITQHSRSSSRDNSTINAHTPPTDTQ